MFLRRKKFIFSLIAFLALVLYQRLSPSEHVLSDWTQSSISPSPIARAYQSIRQEAQVVRVIDGDTIEVLLDGKKAKVRIIGINTPETVDPRRPVGCFGKEASKFAKQILTGQVIILESDPTQSNVDRYGRLLRYVFVNGLDFGKKMISDGYAYEYTYDLPYKYQSEYKNAERQARERGLGLWVSCN